MKRIDKAIVFLFIINGIFLLIASVAFYIYNTREASNSNSVKDKRIPSAQVLAEMTTQVVTATPVPTEKSYGIPVNIRIEKINVNATIQALGLTTDGALASPNNLSDVGWYINGAKPGEIGSAVLNGHTGVSTAGVFKNLQQLTVGDFIVITDNLGKETIFEVRELKTYGRDDRVPEIFYNNDSAHLNLITCEGEYIITRGGTPNRLVVFTDLYRPKDQLAITKRP